MVANVGVFMCVWKQTLCTLLLVGFRTWLENIFKTENTYIPFCSVIWNWGSYPKETRAHAHLPLSPYAPNKHWASTLCKKPGEWPKQIKYTSLPWEIYKSNLRSFQVVNKLLPLGSAPGYYTCSLYETEVSLDHRLQHSSAATCAMFLLWLCMEEQIDKMSPLLLRTWITGARTVIIHVKQTKASLKDLWICIKNSKCKLLIVKSNHGHYVLQWYQQTFSS